MSLQEQLIKILKKEQVDDLIIFLKDLKPEDKKGFVPGFKKVVKQYSEFKETSTPGGGRSFSASASTIQFEILALTGFVVYNRADFDKMNHSTWILGGKRMMEILSWYCPSWFNDYINGFAMTEFIPRNLTYEWLMDLKDAGLAAPGPELVAKVLPNLIFEPAKDYKSKYVPANLFKHPLTLKEHIWGLFQFESQIHNSDRYLQLTGLIPGQQGNWIETFKDLATTGDIDREQLLREAIGATTKGFNKVSTGWFAELFTRLEPTTAELLPLQDQLLNALNSQHSKPVNAVLTFFKKLADEPAFQVEEFLEYSALLFSSETKSVVAATLAILEKVAKKYPGKQEQVLLALSQAFIHNDETLQVRAARMIRKYGTAGSEALTVALSPYQQNFLSATRTLLQDFLPDAMAVELVPATGPAFKEPEPVLTEENVIPVIHNFDELVFLATQAFDNHEPYHLDLLPAALLQYKSEIRRQNIAKLAPAFQRAYNLLVLDFTSSMGYLDHLLATFFMNYGIYLINTFPGETAEIQELHAAFMKKDQDLQQKWSWRGLRLCQLSGWQAYEKDTLYMPYKQLLLLTLDKLRADKELPLLSTPTHLPCWISPIVLIDRLEAYLASGEIPCDIDFQMALARVKLEERDKAIAYAESKLTGEYRHVMRFLLHPEARPAGPFVHESWWMAAALTKDPASAYEEFRHFSYNKRPRTRFTGQFPWKCFEEHYTIDRYDYATKKTIKQQATRKVFRVDFERQKAQTKVKGFLSKLIPGGKEPEPLLYEYLVLKARNLSAEYNDIQRLLLLVPNNPEPLLGYISRKSLQYPTFWEEGDKRLVTRTVEALLLIWQHFGAMAHVFVATCMLSSDKTIRAFAAEIWLKGVSEGSIQNESLGEVIGIHESIEFAPLKRFTDLIISNMFQISDPHNRALEQVLTAVLLQLPDKPVKNLKPLLQIYLEVLFLNGTSIKEKVLINKVATWQKAGSLSKIAKSLSAKTALY